MNPTRFIPDVEAWGRRIKDRQSGFIIWKRFGKCWAVAKDRETPYEFTGTVNECKRYLQTRFPEQKKVDPTKIMRSPDLFKPGSNQIFDQRTGERVSYYENLLFGPQEEEKEPEQTVQKDQLKLF